MKRYMICCFVFATLTILQLCGGGISAALPCKVPSSSTKKCYHPTNAVSDCSAWNGVTDCVGKSMYLINDFPDGTTDAEKGTTEEKMVDCYQETRCGQDENCPQNCVVKTTLPYILGTKVVPGSGKCPTE